jgi:DNA-binding NtrC family response regulator
METVKTILVIEDERPLQNAIKIKLEKSGFEVVAARAVDQAKGYITDVENISAIWLDHYLLGKEDGLDFVAWCKEGDNKCRKIPIFVVSNTASAEKVKSYMQLGVAQYNVKSERRLDEIIDDIREYLNKDEEV